MAEHTLDEIVRVLGATYTDEGVRIWLTAKNQHLKSKPDGNWSCTPAEYIAAGHIDEVYDVACRIDGGGDRDH